MSRAFNGISDKITLTTSASLDSAAPAFTMMAWVFPTSVAMAVPASIGDRAFFIRSQFGFSELDAGVVGSSGSALSVAPINSLPLGVWAHIAMTYDDTGDKKAHLFINGVEVAYLLQNPVTGNALSRVGLNVSIGSDLNATQPFGGDIAEFQLYNTVLTPAQIVTAMNAVVPIPGNLEAYLHLCGVMSPEPDVSGNGNVGILTGTTPGPDSPGFICMSPTPNPTTSTVYIGQYPGDSFSSAFFNPFKLDIVQVINEGKEVVWNLDAHGVANVNPASPTLNALLCQFEGSSFSAAFPNMFNYDLLQVVTKGGFISFFVTSTGQPFGII